MIGVYPKPAFTPTNPNLRFVPVEGTEVIRVYWGQSRMGKIVKRDKGFCFLPTGRLPPADSVRHFRTAEECQAAVERSVA